MLEKEFRAEIKGGLLRNAYFFLGSEEYLKRVARKNLKNAVITGEDFDSFNHSIFSAAVSSPAELREPLSSFPFMSDKKLVEYVDVDQSLFTGNKLKELKELLSNDELFESSVLCIISTPDGFEFAKRSAEKKFNDIIENELSPLLTTVNFNTPAPAELAKWVVRHLEHNGVHCSSEFAKALIARGGRNMDRLALETDKLACFVLSKGRDAVSIDDLDTVSVADPELNAFALSNAILSYRLGDALDALAAAKRDKEKPVTVLAGIMSSYADMIVVKELSATGISDREISAKTGIFEYRVKLCRNAVATASKEMLERSLELCIDCDGMLKSGSSGFAPIERLLCEFSLLRRNDRA